MIPISMLLLMGLSALVSVWLYDHVRLMKELKAVMTKAEVVAKDSLEMAKQIQKVHNEQAEEYLKLSRKVEELSNKVEMSQLFKSGKMFNETKPKT